MYESLINQERAQRAILDEYLPEWETLSYDGAEFARAWCQATRTSRATAYRWLQKAQALADRRLGSIAA